MFLNCSPVVLAVPVKTCSKCGEVKPATREHFGLNRGKLRSYCLVCQRGYNKAHYDAHADQMRARRRDYYAVHADDERESRRGYQREYSRIHSEKKRQRTAQFRANNPGYMAKWRADNAERLKSKRQSPEGREANKVIAHRRRVRKIANGGSFTVADLAAIRAAQTDRQGRLICWLCGKPIEDTPDLDHWIPILRGGPNNAGNLHYMHDRCNRSKGAKLPAELGRLI